MIPHNLRRDALALLLCSAVLMWTRPASAAPAPQSAPSAQATQAQPPTAANPADLADYVKKQFGPSFTLAPLAPRGVGGQREKNAAPILLLTGDLDGDGQEDAVIITQSKNALLDAQQFGYKVIDPYDTYFGFGNPHLTQQFAMQDPEREHTLLVVHGWRQAAPKAKFVIINLPFDNLALASVMVKKKPRLAILTEESGLLNSSVYWDGKRYKYEPGIGKE